MENSVNNVNQFYFFFRHREIHTMDSKSDNVEIMIGYEAGDIIEELFQSFGKRY